MTRHRKIETNVCVIQTASVSIMATGRIELGSTGKAVAANIKRLRERRGLSLRALSKRLDETGRKLSADALNKIENGRLQDDPEYKGKPLHIRRVDADDLVAIAIALGVNPSALLLPPRADDSEIEVTGAGRVNARRAWQWADGRAPLVPITDDPEDAATDFHYNARPAGLRHLVRRGERTPEELARRRIEVQRLAELLHPDSPEARAAFIEDQRRQDPEPWEVDA